MGSADCEAVLVEVNGKDPHGIGFETKSAPGPSRRAALSGSTFPNTTLLRLCSAIKEPTHSERLEGMDRRGSKSLVGTTQVFARGAPS